MRGRDGEIRQAGVTTDPASWSIPLSRPLQLTSWNHELERRFPDLPTATVFVLALYSFGMILAKVSGLSTVTLFLGKELGLSYFAPRDRLCEFYKEAPAKSGVKSGVKRQDFDV